MLSIAASAIFIRARALFVIFFLTLTGCTLPRPASTPVVYDFGPGSLQAPASTGTAALEPIEITTAQASSALGGVAVLYRLGYADAQALQPYTLARWSMPPAQLIDQRLRARLSLRRPVIVTGEILQAKPPQRSASTPLQAALPPPPPDKPMLNLRLTLEEFSQLFTSPSQSSGLLRLRATLTLRHASHDTLLAQRSFVVQAAAPSADASGGVRALTAATDLAISEIEQWLAQIATAAP
jgi:cholesterol transport system auxiliary component